MTVGQIPLDLPPFGREETSPVTGDSNAQAFSILAEPQRWHLATCVLIGPEASGKSVMTRAWARERGGLVIDASDISEANVSDLAAASVLAVDDADTASDERAVMTLLEARRVDTRPTLFAARRPPAQWPLELPDLRSRLTACTRATIHEPDEAMLKALLHRGLQARGLTPSTSALDFAAARMERSYAAARHLIDCLDRHALAHGRKVTRALVQDVMAGESI